MFNLFDEVRRSQGQIWDISQKVSSRGVQFTSKFWLGVASSILVGILILPREIGYLF